jgi:hypothetical protein
VQVGPVTPDQLRAAAAEIMERVPAGTLVLNKVGHLEIRDAAGAAVGVLDLHDGSVDWWGQEPEPMRE